MITKLVAYTVTCNDCGARTLQDPTVEAARSRAYLQGWLNVGEVGDLCPKCAPSAFEKKPQVLEDTTP